jgi:hypothetical protein
LKTWDDSQENKWIVWYCRLGYMPFETIQSMTTTSQGMDELVGILMPQNYISSNVLLGKTTNLNLETSAST